MLERISSEERDGYILGPIRVALGVMIFRQTLLLADELSKLGFFGDKFHLPFFPEAFVPSQSVYSAIIAAQLVLAALVIVGHRARVALFASAVLAIYVLLCDRLQFHHNRYSLALFSLLISLTPCDRSWVLFDPSALAKGTRMGPFFCVHLARIQVAIVYLASGTSKLADPDWRAGLVLGDRIHRFGGVAIARGVPSFIVEFLGRADTASAISKLAIMTELGLAIALFFPRTRIFALWWGVMFHLTIQATAYVEIFTVLMLAMYGVFVTPDVRARKLFYDPTRGKGRAFARVVRLLDWFARFEVAPWAPDDLKKGHSIVVVRRDGSRATGVRALAMLARCLPLFFPLWAPLAFIASFTKGGEPATHA